MKKIFQMLILENYVIEVWETCYALGSPIQGNLIGSHYVLMVHLVSTHLIGIAVARN